jgi:methylated-DNA-[protein]-cysteine S-methyltransferase
MNWALFDASIGRCGIVWSERGIVAVQLPETGERETQVRLLRSRPEAIESVPPDNVQAAIDAITALLRGERIDLSFIPLDVAGVPEFHRRVYDIARTIAPGSTLTYGDIAKRLGDVTLSRAVGQALGRNPFVVIVPCHRVLAAGGKVGGFSAPGGAETKVRMLKIEGVQLGEPDLFDLSSW